jgi:hypothetical protein
MSTDAGVKEAPYPYHISLNFQDSVDEILQEVIDKWHGRAHVLQIDHISPGAFDAFKAFAVVDTTASASCGCRCC